jgi:circadian clock protein KaiB
MGDIDLETRDLADWDDHASDSSQSRFALRLFVAGTTNRSIRAIANIKQICENELDGRYDLEVIDIYQRPEAAMSEQIVAAPTLIKSAPLPFRRLIGDLSDRNGVAIGLGLRPTAPNMAVG